MAINEFQSALSISPLIGIGSLSNHTRHLGQRPIAALQHLMRVDHQCPVGSLFEGSRIASQPHLSSRSSVGRSDHQLRYLIPRYMLVYLFSESTIVLGGVGVVILPTVSIIIESGHIGRWRKHAAVNLPSITFIKIEAYLARISYGGQLIRLNPLDT
jgi:hypothetical protein